MTLIEEGLDFKHYEIAGELYSVEYHDHIVSIKLNGFEGPHYVMDAETFEKQLYMEDLHKLIDEHPKMRIEWMWAEENVGTTRLIESIGFYRSPICEHCDRSDFQCWCGEINWYNSQVDEMENGNSMISTLHMQDDTYFGVEYAEVSIDEVEEDHKNAKWTCRNCGMEANEQISELLWKYLPEDYYEDKSLEDSIKEVDEQDQIIWSK